MCQELLENEGIIINKPFITNEQLNFELLPTIISSNYIFSDSAEITMLSQLGIATNAGGYSGGYSQSKLRGYLEIDEKKKRIALTMKM